MSCQILKKLIKPKQEKQVIMKTQLIQSAKKFMIEYMSDGETRRPSDFDWDILGASDFYVMGLPRWNATPFFYALGELVEEGIIIHKTKKDGTHTYKIKK